MKYIYCSIFGSYSYVCWIRHGGERVTMGNRRPKVVKAREFVEALVQRYRGEGTTRLPRTRELALQAGVSAVTMWKALTELREQGLLTVQRGTGISIASRPDSAGPPPAGPGEAACGTPLLKWQSALARVKRAVGGGTYVSGAMLPPVKQLMAKHGVSYRTMRKVLTALCADHTLERHGGGYRVPMLVSRHGTGEVVLIAGGDDAGRLGSYNPRTFAHVHALEVACIQARTALHVWTFDPDTGILHTPSKQPGTVEAVRFPQTTLGFVVFGVSLDDHLPRLVNSLLSHCRPVALLDENGMVRMEELHVQSGRLKVFSMANRPTCGRAMGRYLLGMGHRRVAYIDPMFAFPWTHNRYAGLAGVYADAGIDDGAVAVTADRLQPFPYLSEGLKRLRSRVDDAVGGVLRSTQERSISTVRLGQRLSEHLYSALWQEILAQELAPLLEQALAHRDVTAWVGTGDRLSLLAMDFAARKGLSVPGDISIVGFDNAPQSRDRGLTSYDFNGPATIHAMLEHVLRPDLRRTTRAVEPAEIEGFVCQRDSVRRIARQETGRGEPRGTAPADGTG